MIFNIALHIYNATVHRTRMKTQFNCVSTNKRQRSNRRKTLRGGIISGEVQPQNAISLMSSQDATQLKSQNEIPLESTESHDATPDTNKIPSVTDVLIEKDSPELESPSIPVGPVGPSIPSPDAIAGGKRTKMKHSTKKSKGKVNATRRVNAKRKANAKRKVNAKRKANATKHKRLKGFK